MEYKDALTLAFQRADQLQTYWSFYATVVLAVLGFFVSLKPERRTLMLAGFVSLAFVGVALANLAALRDVAYQRLALQERLIALAGEDAGLRDLAHTITPSSVTSVTFFHTVVDAFTLISMWTLVVRSPEADVRSGG